MSIVDIRATKIISDKSEEIIKNFKDDAENDSFLKSGIKEVLDNYEYDNKHFTEFPSTYRFKNISQESTNPTEQCYFLLKQKLIQAYDNDLNEIEVEIPNNKKVKLKQLFTNQYFEDEKTYRCPTCGEILSLSGKDKYIKEKLLRTQIDHLFPKNKYPQFTLNPENFVPICRDCNEFEKNRQFLDTPAEFNDAIKALGINKFKHPFNLHKHVPVNFKYLYNPNAKFIKLEENSSSYKLLKIYGIPNRFKIAADNCLSILFSYLKHSKITTPESLENIVEVLASSNFDEVNAGYSLNNNPQVWKEFLDWILYSDNNLSALWQEIKDRQIKYSNFIY